MRSHLGAVAIASALSIVAACGSSKDEAAATPDAAADVGARGSEHVGQSCTAATDCYKGLEGGSVKGTVQCLDRVTGGYCTHLCQTDADCCAVPGECVTGFKQLCAPFESTGQMMCFLSCESGDLHTIPTDAGVDAAGTVPDPTVYCQYYVGTDFLCRSTGGGRDNKQVCVPGGGGTSDAGPG